MSETNKNKDFSKLLEESLKDILVYKRGQNVSGTIIKITQSNIIISLNAKQDAFADVIEYQNDDGTLAYKVGDILEGFILKVTENAIEIGKALSSDHASQMKIEEAIASKIPVVGKVIQSVKGGFTAEVLGRVAFCPYSHMELSKIENEALFLGKTFNFNIIKFEDGSFVISRKTILEKERKLKKEAALKALSVGKVVSGVVQSFRDFAAFVDLSGVSGFLHISNISWSKISHPSKILKIGDKIEVKVIGLKLDKVDLSIKALSVDPMILALKELKEGDIVTCKVIKNLSFGSFVEISPGVQGLIPISELSWGKRIKTPDEVLSPGDTIEAQILNINSSKKQLSLSFKNLKDNPWQKIDEYAKEGEPIKGVIEGIAKFGIFVEIVEGVTGLLPMQKMEAAKLYYDENDIGKEITLKVDTIDKVKRKLSLDPVKLPKGYYIDKQKADNDKGSARDWKKYAHSKSEVDESNPFANL